MKIFQGDIIVATIPYSDFSQGKLRPCLVVSNDLLNRSEDIIVVAISSQENSHHGLSLLDKDLQEGTLKIASYVHCHKILRIKKSDTIKIVAHASPQFVKKVVEKIIAYLS